MRLLTVAVETCESVTKAGFPQECKLLSLPSSVVLSIKFCHGRKKRQELAELGRAHPLIKCLPGIISWGLV
jgi:hypothetical protein